VATETLLADFLREIRDVSAVRKRYEEQLKLKQERELTEPAIRQKHAGEILPDITVPHSERAAFIPENNTVSDHNGEPIPKEDHVSEVDYRDTGGMTHYFTNQLLLIRGAAWIPGQGVNVDYAAIIEILVLQLDMQRLYHPFKEQIMSDAQFTFQMTRFNNLPLCDGWPNSSTSPTKSWFLLHHVSFLQFFRTWPIMPQ
jgi:hypothetical protein